MAIACPDVLLRRDVPLAPLTTMKVGGTADLFAEPASLEELSALLSRGGPIRILGSGANLLVRDSGVRGLVIRLHRLQRRRGLYVEAGRNLATLVKETVAEGRAGLECLAGVPATVGGAVAMNAGGRHGEIGSAVKSVDVIEEGRLVRRSRAEVGFRYRGTALGSAVVVGAELDLGFDPGVRARYEEILAAKKATQPLGCRNAGCMFRNPTVLSAGRVIDEAGLKGRSVGGIHVSRKHANFFINDGSGTADDAFRLVDLVREEVRRRTGIELELEIVVWGEA